MIYHALHDKYELGNLSSREDTKFSLAPPEAAQAHFHTPPQSIASVARGISQCQLDLLTDRSQSYRSTSIQDDDHSQVEPLPNRNTTSSFHNQLFVKASSLSQKSSVLVNATAHRSLYLQT